MGGSARTDSLKLLSCNILPCLDCRRPIVHQAASALEEITPRIGRLRWVAHRMGERGLDHFAGCVCTLRRAIPERTDNSFVRTIVDAEAMRTELFQGSVGEDATEDHTQKRTVVMVRLCKW